MYRGAQYGPTSTRPFNEISVRCFGAPLRCSGRDADADDLICFFFFLKLECLVPGLYANASSRADFPIRDFDVHSRECTPRITPEKCEKYLKGTDLFSKDVRTAFRPPCFRILRVFLVSTVEGSSRNSIEQRSILRHAKFKKKLDSPLVARGTLNGEYRDAGRAPIFFPRGKRNSRGKSATIAPLSFRVPYELLTSNEGIVPLVYKRYNDRRK